MELDFHRVKESTAWIGKTTGMLKTTLPLFAIGAPLAGYFVSKKRTGLKGIPQMALRGIQALRHFRAFMKGFRSGQGKPIRPDRQFSEHFRPG